MPISDDHADILLQVAPDVQWYLIVMHDRLDRLQADLTTLRDRGVEAPYIFHNANEIGKILVEVFGGDVYTNVYRSPQCLGDAGYFFWPFGWLSRWLAK